MFCIVIVVRVYVLYCNSGRRTCFCIVTVAIEEKFENTGLERQYFVTCSHGEG